MKTFSKFLLAVCVILGFAGTTMAATAPSLGLADGYSVFGKAGITETPAATTHVWGNVGSDTTIGLIAWQVDGSIITPTPATIENAIATAYGALSQTPATGISLAGTVTVTPGVYTVLATETLDGTVTLSGAGVYIFRSASAFHVWSDAKMLLAGGADECNVSVFWQIPTTMTIGTNAHIIGTIITESSHITIANGATLQGRAFALGAGQVTLDNNQITRPVCTVFPGTGTLHVIKNVINIGGGTAVASDFIISVHTSTGVFAGSGLGLWTPGTTYLLSSWTYTVTEPINVDYTTTFSLLLGDCLNFTISSGDDKTCTVLNTYIIPTPTPSGGGGWWSLLIDVCPEWDYSTSYYDWICWLLPAAATQSIHIVKVANRLIPFPYGGGDVVYTYAVTNPSNTAISDVVVTDDKCSPIITIGGDVNNDDLLDTDEVRTYTCSTNISVTTRNIATVVGEANGVTVSDTDFANVVVESPISVVPKLPKTGLAGIALWNLAILGGIFLVFSISFVVALRKRDI